MMDPDTYAAISKAPPLTLSSEPLLPPAPPPASRSADNMMPGQWKQEFYKLREKLDHVSRANQEAKHTLDIANAKMKELEDENNLLLDALFIASQPIPKPGAPRPKTQTDQMHYSPQHVRERYGHRQPPPPTHQQHQQQSQYSQYNSKYHSAHNQLPPPVPHSPYHHPEHEDPTTHQREWYRVHQPKVQHDQGPLKRPRVASKAEKPERRAVGKEVPIAPAPPRESGRTSRRLATQPPKSYREEDDWVDS